MSKCHTPVFLARTHADADDLVEQLHEARVDAEIGEVIVGEDRPGWQVLVTAPDAERARSMATLLEVQRYGNWETRDSAEVHWGVMEDESALRDPTEVYSAQSLVQAYLLKNLLADQGIAAIVTNHLLHGGSGVDLVGTPTAAKVVVAAEDAAPAREFALDFEDQTLDGAGWPGDEPIDHGSTPWPTCPGCEKRRTTRCPICQTSGTDFTEADRGFLGELVAAAESPTGSSCGCSGSCSTKTDSPSDKSCSTQPPPAEESPEEDPETMLMCSVCDEPFEPTYPKHCEWCGYEFEEGYVIKQIVAPEEIPGRVIAVVVALGLLLLGGMAYFMVIL